LQRRTGRSHADAGQNSPAVVNDYSDDTGWIPGPLAGHGGHRQQKETDEGSKTDHYRGTRWLATSDHVPSSCTCQAKTPNGEPGGNGYERTQHCILSISPPRK
jgi:hypothetical protein